MLRGSRVAVNILLAQVERYAGCVKKHMKHSLICRIVAWAAWTALAASIMYNFGEYSELPRQPLADRNVLIYLGRGHLKVYGTRQEDILNKISFNAGIGSLIVVFIVVGFGKWLESRASSPTSGPK
jgi:hypothetical protein